jgi:MFS transporter, DHA1 family, multidrug resistance protein
MIANQDLSDAARKRGLAVMLADTFLMWGGFFMVIPLIAVHYVDDLKWAAGAIGLVLGVRQVMQQGLTLVGGALADRLGARGLIAIGLMGYWFMWVQTTISLPLLARAISGTNDAVSWVYALNAGMGIVLQYPLLWLAERRMQPLAILVLGVIIMALGLGFVGLAYNVPTLLGCVALFAVGRLLASPAQQSVAASLANPGALGSYFGVSALALAFGGGIGNTTGGMLYELGQALGAPALPWMIYSAAGLASALGLALLARGQARRDAVPALKA